MLVYSNILSTAYNRRFRSDQGQQTAVALPKHFRCVAREPEVEGDLRGVVAVARFALDL